MKKSLVLLGALTLLLSSPGRADLLSEIRQAGKLKVGIAVGVPRFSYLDAQQSLQGSDVDTARLLARDWGLELQIVALSNAERVSAVETRKVDMVISSLSITPEREQQISFSIPYARLYTIIAAHPRQAISSYPDLAGKRIGVTLKSSNAALLAQYAGQSVIQGFDSDAQLIAAAVKGKVDIISSQHAVLDEINREAGKALFEEKFVQKEFDLAIGLPRQEKALREQVNGWLGNRLRDGSLNHIYRRHHQRDLPAELRPAIR